MESNEKTFKHSYSFDKIVRSIGILFYVPVLGIMAFTSEMELWQRLFFGAAFLFFFLFLVYDVVTFTPSLRLSSEKIIVRNWFGEKSLEWNEIARISAFGRNLLLHDHDSTVNLIVDSQLKGYLEILEFVFKKRSDLFKKEENLILRGMGYGLLVSTCVVLFAAFIIFVLSVILKIVFGLMAVFIVIGWFRDPQSITLEKDSLLVTYLFREVNYPARLISSIDLVRPSGGRSYCVKVTLRTGKTIDLSTFPHGGILNYPSLKRWYKKAMAKQSPVTF